MAATFKVHLKKLILQKSLETGDIITQKEIHEATKLSLPTIGRWMAGKVDRVEAETVKLFTEYLGCSMLDLLELEDSEGSGRPAKDGDD